MERFMGLDAHGKSCTFPVVGPSGRKLRHHVVATNGAALVNYVRTIPGKKHLCLEEGTRSAWLYEILAPHVEELVVAGVGESRGQKNDRLDAFRRAEELQTGTVKTSVFKSPRHYARLRELARVHTMLVRDVVRVQSRLKATYRARGVATPGRSVYNPSQRSNWLKQLPVSSRWAAEVLHEEYARLLSLKQEAEAELVAESRRYRIAGVVATASGLGAIRVAQLLPIVNSTLKANFKGAATTLITRLHSDPLYAHYLQLTAAGTKPNLAKLTVARRVAAIVLGMWKDEQEYEPGKLKQQVVASAVS